jgi:serine/threonine protein phosphatase 1
MAEEIHPSWAQPAAGTRVYAVGDIHGRLDLLDALHRRILGDSEQGAPQRQVIVYLGDYVDRGPESREVIDRLLGQPLAGFEVVHLKGNHEDLMLEFLEKGTRGELWIRNGADRTLESYGIEVPMWLQPDLDKMHMEFAERLPAAHLRFLHDLQLMHREGDYLFAHAGVRPGVALDQQVEEDVVWIRDLFLNSDADFGARVVHGHTIVPEPVLKRNRIGIDTGAFRTNRLTCAVLEADTVRLLQT